MVCATELSAIFLVDHNGDVVGAWPHTTPVQVNGYNKVVEETVAGGADIMYFLCQFYFK